MATIGSAQVLIRPSMVGMVGSVSSQMAVAGAAGGRVGGNALGESLKKWGKRGAIVAGAAVVAGVAATLKSGFDRLTALEDAEASLRGLGYTAQEVNGIMDDVIAATEGTAMRLDETAQVAATMVASGIEPGKELEETLRLVGDAATIANVGVGEMGAIFSKVAASNKISMMEVNQLQAQGIPIMQMLADELGVTQDAVREMVSAGEVDFETFSTAMEDKLGGAAEEAGKTTRGALENLGAYVARAGAALLEGVMPAFRDGINKMSEWLEAHEETLTAIGESIGEWIGDAAEKVSEFIDEFNDGDGAIGGFGTAVRGAGSAVGWLLGKGAELVGWFSQTSAASFALKASLALLTAGFIASAAAKAVDLAQTIALKVMYAGQFVAALAKTVVQLGLQAAAWVASTAAMVAQKVAMIAVTVATHVWTAAQWLLNVALNANPLGLIVAAIALLVGAFVLAWKNSETFREVVTAAWDGIKAAAMWAWNFLRDNVFPHFVAAFEWLKETATKVTDAMGDAWQWLKNKFVAAWNLINNLVFEPFKAAFALVKALFSGDSEEIRRTWNNLKNKMVGIWNAIKDYVFEKFKAAFNAVKNFFSDKVENIKGYWQGLKDNLKAGYDWINTNVFQKFRDGLSWLGDKVNDAKNRIGRIWDAVKDKFATPINWVIDNVWNKGIKRVFQAVVDVIPGLNVTIPSVGRIGGGGGYGTSGGGFTGAGRSLQARAEGGPVKKGWVLAGEEGPELIKMAGSGFVYTANETKRMLASQNNPMQDFSAGDPPHGGKDDGPTVGTNAWFLGKAAGVGDWILGGLATAAEAVLKPVKSALSSAAGGGKFGDLLSGTSTWAMDEVVKWLKKEDDEAEGGPWMGISDLKGRSLRGAKGHVNAAAFSIADAIQPGMFMQAFNQSMQGAHGIGLAVDFMAKGGNLQKTADYMVANHKKLNGLWEVIYNHKMWTKGRGWRPLRGGRGNDPGHVWHVHGGWGKATSYDNGGWLLPGQAGMNYSSQPEAVFSASQWDVLKQNLPGGGGASYNAYITTETGATDESIADSVLYGMRRLNRGGVHSRA